MTVSEEGFNSPSGEPGSSFKYDSPSEAYKSARRRILNNALRRKQAKLDLSNFGLVELPPEIGELHFLREINISNNQLVSLPSEIGNMRSLLRLDAQQNKLVGIPDTVGRLRNLRILNLQKNKIRELPRTIGHLSRLDRLNLESNSLKRLPPEIGELSRLTNLNLDNNELATLTPEIGRLVELRYLSLDNNQLSHLTPAVARLGNLIRLDLDKNKISTLPAEFAQLHRLSSLYMNGNELSEFPAVVLELPQLRTLMLGSNKIASLPPTIHRAQRLVTLYLRNNQIQRLPSEIASLQLQQLNLADNRLSDLPNALGYVRSLEVAARKRQNYYRPDTVGLIIEDNPFPAVYRRLIALGQPASTENILAWLRGELDPNSLSSDDPAAHEPNVPSPPEPSEEAGPTFHVVDGQVDLVNVGESNDFDREIQETLHRRLQRQIRLLCDATTKVGNQHPQLQTVVDEYENLVQPIISEINIVELWAAGNALMAQANSFQTQDKARTLSEPLEPSHLGLLAEVAALHGSFILGFPTAAQLTLRADRSRVGPDQIRTIAAPTSNVLSALSRQRRLLSPRARQLVESLDAALLTGSWDAARIGYTSYATVRNALVAVGRVCIWINDKGGSLSGGAILATAITAANLPPDTFPLIISFLKSNAAEILSFASPFPELRAYLEWIINHFDELEASTKSANHEDNLKSGT